MAAWDTAAHGTGSRHSYPWLADLLFALDEWLRRRDGIFEYTANPGCIFRLNVGVARRPLALGDGTRVEPGQRIARLHFWNEHVPPVPPGGTSIAWARQMQQAIANSLRDLAAYLATRPDLSDVNVICGDVPTATRSQSDQLARIMSRYGFEAIAEPGRLSVSERLHRLGENILITLLVLAQNARTLRPDTLLRVRVPIYLSRRRLVEKFGDAGKTAATMAEAS